MIDASVKAVLLDIEGTTSSIAFVYDVMFPYVRRNIDDFLTRHILRADVMASIHQMAVDAGYPDARLWRLDQMAGSSQVDRPPHEFVGEQVKALMDRDSKSTGLKSLQGLIWQAGFESGELQSHLFSDVVPALEDWHRRGIAIGIYSSGSIVAQKLFFGHTPHGDLNRYFIRNYDTTIGPKRVMESYQRIAADFGFAPNDILFLSDIAAELDAATNASFQTLVVVRPGNAALPESDARARIESFEQLHLTPI
jgi:enolase-phosphatase E1